MRHLPDILHNVADHTETLLQLLDDAAALIPSDFRQRLYQHILLEEKENTVELQALKSGSPNQLVQKLLDHSFFLQGLIQEPDSFPMALKRELLDHFMEEHQEWMSELSAIKNNGWTVGPLWSEGG